MFRSFPNVQNKKSKQTTYSSNCRSSCWGISAVKRTAGKNTPNFMDSLFNLNTLMFSCVSICWTFVCLMCTYQKVVSSNNDPFWACSSISFVGTALTAMTSILFVISPSEPTCLLRLSLYSFSLMFVVAPILIRVNYSNFNNATIFAGFCELEFPCYILKRRSRRK